MSRANTVVAFAGEELIARGPLEEVVLHCRSLLEEGEKQRIAVFDDDTGAVMDIDFSGNESDLLERLRPKSNRGSREAAKRRGPGRPKLGVVCREVSLLPRHWQWLSEQQGGASATLRRLVEAARRHGSDDSTARQAIEAAHRFLWDMAGNLPNFEEATRALYASDFERLEALTTGWPADIRSQLSRFTSRARTTAEVSVDQLQRSETIQP